MLNKTNDLNWCPAEAGTPAGVSPILLFSTSAVAKQPPGIDMREFNGGGASAEPLLPNAPRSPASQAPPDHLRQLLSMVDSTLMQIGSLPLLTQDEVPATSFLDRSTRSDASLHPKAPLLASESTDDLISFESSCPPPAIAASALLSESSPRCLLCDDCEWHLPDKPDDVDVASSIDPKKRSVTFSAETANKGVSTEQHLPVDHTLEEIDHVVHAILTSLSSSKASQTKIKNKRRAVSDTETRRLDTDSAITHSAKKPLPKLKRNNTETQLFFSKPRAVPAWLPARSPVRQAIKRSAKRSKSPQSLSLVKPFPVPTTSSTFRESSISTRTSRPSASVSSPRETRSVREERSFKDAPPYKGNSPSFPRKAKKGAEASVVMEPLMTVVRQIANARKASDGDVMLVVTGSKQDAPPNDTAAPASSLVCIQLARNERQKISSVLSTMLAEHQLVDVGTMTDDASLPTAPVKAKSVSELGTGDGDCVLVVRPGVKPSSSSTSSAPVILCPKGPKPDLVVRITTTHPLTSSNRMVSVVSQHLRRRRRHRRRRSERQRRSQRDQTRSFLRQNSLLTLCVSMLSLAFGSLSFSVESEHSK